LVSAKSQFIKLWGRTPVALKPKFPPRDEQVGETADYQEWIRLCDTITDGDILAFKKEADELPLKPLISVVMPVFDPPKRFLIKAIESVRSQAYENWELCIADDASTKKYIRPLLESYARKDSRIKVTFRKTNGHISVASNSALKLATGAFIALLDHDDELRPHALFEIVKVINANPDAKLIYSDEDKIDEFGDRYDPYFKPDWNPELLLGQNYISHLGVYKTSLVRKLNGFRKGFEGSQDWDLVLRFTEQISNDFIIHIPHVLYHWRAVSGSTAMNITQKNYLLNSSLKVVQDSMYRRKVNSETNFIFNDSNYLRTKIKHNKKENPKVSIIIPTKDNFELLKRCIDSILSTIKYKNFEIIIIDNGSTLSGVKSFLNKIKTKSNINVINLGCDFNYSKLNNFAISKSSGEVLLLLNDDIEANVKGWFEEMLTHTLRPEIGCVGSKLIYPDGRLQHGGVVIGLGGGAVHNFKFSEKSSRGYFGHLALTRNCSAVTAACLMVRKEVFKEVGGLDESMFKVAFNDVDFCLRVQKMGYRNLWTPNAELLHHESASRGDDFSTSQRKSRFLGELSALQYRWNIKRFVDPYYNQNLTKWSDTNRFKITLKKELANIESETESQTEVLDRNQYKETWNKLAENFESAKLYVTGDADEKALKNSSIQTIKRIHHFVRFSKNDIVLEIGCGIGRVGKELAPSCKKWIGCDISGNMLRYARERLSHLKNIKLIELPECNLAPIQDSSIDVVYCTVVFMHLDEWDRYEYIKEAFRVLKPGGRAYFDNFSLTTDEGWQIFKDHCDLKKRPSHISKSSTPEELREYLVRSKFTSIQAKIDEKWAVVTGLKT